MSPLLMVASVSFSCIMVSLLSVQESKFDLPVWAVISENLAFEYVPTNTVLCNLVYLLGHRVVFVARTHFWR